MLGVCGQWAGRRQRERPAAGGTAVVARSGPFDPDGIALGGGGKAMRGYEDPV